MRLLLGYLLLLTIASVLASGIPNESKNAKTDHKTKEGLLLEKSSSKVKKTEQVQQQSSTTSTATATSKIQSKPGVATITYWTSKYRNASGGGSEDGKVIDYVVLKDLWKDLIRVVSNNRSTNGLYKQLKSSALTADARYILTECQRAISRRVNTLLSRSGNIAAIGIAVLGGFALVAPLLFPDFRRSMGRSLSTDEQKHGFPGFITNGLVGISESIMGFVEKSVDDLPSLPRLDAQECVKRCICEAHNQPKKYGLVGLMLQLFFPPYTETDEPSRIVSKYQLAARYGRQENANCGAQYDGCMVNFLDMVQGVINLIF